MIESELNILDKNDSSENFKLEQGKQDESQILFVDNVGAKAESIEKDPRFKAIEDDMSKKWFDRKIPISQPRIVTFTDEAGKQFRENFPNNANDENITKDPRYLAIYKNVKTNWEETHVDRGANGYWNRAYEEKLTGITESHTRHFELEVEEQFRERFPNDAKAYDTKARVDTPEKIPTDRTSILVDGRWINISELKPSTENP